MKILTISNLYPPNIVGGYEALCFEVMQALAARDHEVTVLTSNYGKQSADFPNQKVIRKLTLLADAENIYASFVCSSAERARINSENIALARETIAAEDPDIVFVWNLHFLDSSFLTTLEGISARKVFLLTDNWLIAFFNPDFIAEYFARKVYACSDNLIGQARRFIQKCSTSGDSLKRLGQHLCKLSGRKQKNEQEINASAIFASRFMSDLYRQAGINFADHVIIHHGTTPLPASQDDRPGRSQLVEDHELRLLFAGRIVEIKGVHTAIEALPKIIKALPSLHIRLTILGDDRDKPYLDRLYALVKKLDLGRHVFFAPAVSETELSKLFQEHDLYLFPSLYEPFALTLIHALRSGIPTVASTAGGTPEIIFHQETGLLFNTGDPVDLARQVILFVKTPDLRDAVSKQAIKHAKDYTFIRMVDDVERYLNTMLEVRS